MNVSCAPCNAPMILLFQVQGRVGHPPAPTTYLFHCQSCGGQAAVQDEKEEGRLLESMQKSSDGGSLVPKPAPKNIQIVRDKLTADDLRNRLMGRR